MIFKKGGRNRGNLSFTYTHQKLEIGKCFKYFGVILTTGGSFNANLLLVTWLSFEIYITIILYYISKYDSYSQTGFVS